MSRIKQTYLASGLAALFLHGVLLILLALPQAQPKPLHWVSHAGKHAQTSAPVKAVSVDQQQVEETIHALKQRQEAKEKARQNHLQHLQQLARQAEHKRQSQQQQLKQLQQQQQQQASAAKKHLQQLKQQQQKAQAKAAKQLKQLKARKQKQQLQLKQLERQQNQAQSAYQQQKQHLQQLQKQLQQAKKQQHNDAEKLLDQQIQQEQQQLQTAKKHYKQGVVNKYNALIKAAIKKHWQPPQNSDSNTQVTLQLQLNNRGDVVNASVQQSSGNAALDRSAITAIYKASPLPMPKKASLRQLFQKFTITMAPRLQD
jgi:colicin import membrane protein